MPNYLVIINPRAYNTKSYNFPSFKQAAEEYLWQLAAGAEPILAEELEVDLSMVNTEGEVYQRKLSLGKVKPEE